MITFFTYIFNSICQCLEERAFFLGSTLDFVLLSPHTLYFLTSFYSSYPPFIWLASSPDDAGRAVGRPLAAAAAEQEEAAHRVGHRRGGWWWWWSVANIFERLSSEEPVSVAIVTMTCISTVGWSVARC